MTDPMAGAIRGMERTLNQVSANQVALSQQQDRIQQAVGRVQNTQDATRNELTTLRARFDDYVRKDELAKNLQLAQTEIIAVRNELETKFGHYAEVRRYATGMMQAIDAGNVTQGVIRQVSEELMLTTPGYWLAPALVALASWLRDDKELAERSLAEALRRDNDKTSLFFALILRRHRRNEATARWLAQYVARQNPSALSHEFVVVLDAVATGALGHEARPMVLDHVRAWHERLCAEQTIVDNQVDRWRKLIDGMRSPIPDQYELLPQLSSTWPKLVALYEGATVHRGAEVFLRGRLDGPLTLSTDLRKRVDDLLGSLVTRHDTEEDPLRHKESELQAILDHKGDKAAAQHEVADKSPVRQANVDFLTLVTNAAFYPDDVGASPGTQRLAIALAKDWIVQADGQLEVANRQALPDGVRLDIDGWNGRIDARTDEQQLITGLSRHIDNETAKAVAQVRFGEGPMVAAIGAGLAMLCALFAAIGGAAGFAVFLLLLAAGLGGWSWHQAHGLPARRDAIRAQGDRRRTAAVVKLRGCIAEALDLRAAWERELANAESVRTYLELLSQDAFLAVAADQTGRG